MEAQDFVNHAIEEGQAIRELVPSRIAIWELALEFFAEATLLFRMPR